MSHTNNSYDYQSDRKSPGEYSTTKESVSSSSYLPTAHVQRIDDQSPINQHQNLDNLVVSIISKNDHYRRSHDVSIEQQISNNDDKDDNSYFALKRLLNKRHGRCDEDSHLSQRVRAFYKEQDELIDDYERVYGGRNEKHDKKIQSLKRQTNILTKVSLAVNIALFLLKIVAAIISKSLSVVSSVIDSAVDLATSVILFWAWHAIKKRDLYRYPQGRTRLEPVAIIILSVIMCAASVLIVYESIDTIIKDTQYFTEKNTTKTLTDIDMSALPISVMVITAVSKAILFVFCYRIKTPTMSALAADHINDVASNIVALVCGLIGSFAYINKINQKAIVLDPTGAILISVYIIITWIGQANDQIKRISGYTANPKFLSQLTWLTYHHSPLIKQIDTVRAFHFGTSYLVEIDIVLPENMPLKEAHDIGEGLQNKIEDLSEVERAFVHLDYDCDHHPSIEHKIV